ncbi:sensor histidine kinase [Clostridium sp. ZS2-4]|uniref:sensor histidine kinase n=1 Tax=Clostridium sp. ZS2-4 TaxID=2987703 RepID=UPI00227CBC47|nr:HAMP domain-containing sensor histidine kinase [Clostridium sp. ZS2-4]MCY6355650.1 HAMP domain-containing sensor histidine kinase [Clostridium sp. ZS2-4]
MKSIKSRLWGSHFVVIFLTVIILELILLVSIKNYYYKGIEEILYKQVKISSNFYSKYLANKPLDTAADDLIESFSYSTNAEVQIIDKNKRILCDSIGIAPGTEIDSFEINLALKGGTSSWQGNQPYTNEIVMAVSAPLKINGNVVGVLRFITSLEAVNLLLKKILIISSLIGILVILSITIVSIMISNTITKPLNQVTDVAKQMAQGEFSLRAKKKYDDEVGSMADTLNYMAQEILKNEKLKNEFISSISHELRTPLTSIKGWALTLKLKEFTDTIKRDEGLDIIIEESERLSSLVEELLDFSRFQAGKITLNIESVKIKELLFNILKQMQPRAERNGIELKHNIIDLPYIKADKNRLKQVFINVLDNALKFTYEGGSINIYTSIQEENVVVSIVDTGCGIKNEQLPNIKKKFYKGDINKAGNGIGLAICDEIILMHGGKLYIESSFGVGTTVKIALKIE